MPAWLQPDVTCPHHLGRHSSCADAVAAGCCRCLGGAGADENAYVVKVYPVAVAGCLLQLGHTVVSGSGLTGVWWGLFIYYLGLLLGFANRFWFHRGHL
jgi:hypothetical protein